MSNDAALKIAKRFVTLPLAKRKLYLQKMHAENISPANLPVPSVQTLFDVIPVSFAQQRQWFLWQMDPQGSAYNLPVALRLKGELDSEALRASFEALQARHQTLRTTFGLNDDQVVQIIHPQSVFTLDVEQVDREPAIDLEQRLQALVEAEARAPFDLEHERPVRVRLLQVAEDDHVLIITLHHIATDGSSMHLMVEELIQHYAHHCMGQPLALPEMPIQYADYAIWQRHWMEAGEQERQLAFWKQHLGTEHPVLELPSDRPRPANQCFEGASVHLEVERRLADALKQLAQQQGATLFTLLLASFQTLLHRYCGQDDIRIGIPVANRNRVETERLIGFFVNTQVLKAEFGSLVHFSDLLAQTRQMTQDAQAHQDLPFEQLVEALHPERSLSHSPLFQVMYNHQKVAAGTRRSLPGLLVENIAWQRKTAQFDLTLNTVEHDEGISAELNYATALFDEPTVQRMARHWINLLQSIVDHPRQRIGELPLLAADEQQEILEHWNHTQAPYPADRSVHQLIEAQAGETPDASAVLFGEQQLTYRQLNQRANRLAHALREQGVGPDVLVGIAVERSLEMVVGLLAILKAGGAYVPFDPEYPRDRLAYMMDDSGIGLLLTQRALLEHLPIPSSVRSIVLDDDDSWLTAFSANDPVHLTHPEHLAYVIYTSGSTGRPKGAANAHQALVNRLVWMQKAYGLGATDTVLQKTPFSFDVSVWEFFWPLLTGARLALAQPGDHRDPERLVSTIQRHGVTTLHFVPSMLQAFMTCEHVERCDTLRRVVCSGEALPADLSEQTLARLPHASLYNLYGPTEAAIDVTHWTCRPSCPGSVPIGTPIDNLKTHILSRDLLALPHGANGELYLGGVGLARGYHRRPSLTAERFVPDPHDASQQGGGRLYRTGDLARYRTGGVIEYAGRIDHQVKIRGLRIELGEIESSLLEHPGVREAVVIDIDGLHAKQLAAYLVLEEGAASHEEILQHLKAALPDYMVPSYLVSLQALPLTPNGKLDRKALPKPDVSQQQKAYVPPQSALQAKLASIWADVLKLERVGITDNFFELGGDSIVSIQVVSRARREGIRFTPKQLFQHQTIQGLACVAEQDDGGTSTLDQGPIIGKVPLLPAQARFFELQGNGDAPGSVVMTLRPTRALDPDTTEKALQAVLAHHDGLRLAFNVAQEAHGAPLSEHQTLWQKDPVLWLAAVQDPAQLDALARQASASLDVHRGILVRAVLATLADGSQRLLLVNHALAMDEASRDIVLQDLRLACEQLDAGQPVALPAKSTSVQSWAYSVHASLEDAPSALIHWQKALAGISHELVGSPREAGAPADSATFGTWLDIDLTRRLTEQAAAAYRAEPGDLLLVALTRVLARWTGQDRVFLGVQADTRRQAGSGVDLGRTVGCLDYPFPVVLDIDKTTLDGAIKGLKQQLRTAADKRLSFAALRYLGDEASRETLAALPVPQCSFSYRKALANVLFEPLKNGEGRESSCGTGLSVDARVWPEGLRIDWRFSSRRFSESTIQGLAEAFHLELLALIEHCTLPGVAGATPSDFPLCSLSQTQLDELPVPIAEIADMYPLSPAQKGMLFHSIEDSGNDLYINQVSLPISGLDIKAFVGAWAAVIARHEVLRTSFHWVGLDEPVQIVHAQAHMPMREIDARVDAAPDRVAGEVAREELVAGFDLTQAPLHRMVLVRLTSSSYQMIWTSHHLLMDGWSKSRLFAELMQHYAGQPVTGTSGRYGDFIAWLQAQDKSRQEAFWRDSLAHSEVTSLSQAVYPRHTSDEPGHHALYTRRDAAWTKRLQQYCRTLRITPNTLIQGAWLLLLQRYTGKRNVTFGATVAGRPESLQDADTTLGLFINTLPVSQTLDPQMRLADWLQALQAYNVELRNWSHTPLNEVQRWSAVPGQKLFDSIIVFENYPIDEGLREAPEAGLEFGDSNDVGVTNFPMDLAVHLNDTLMIEYLYLRNAFSEQAVDGIRQTMESVLETLLQDAQARLGNLDIVPAAQRAPVADTATQALASYRPERMAELIIEHAHDRPDAIALVCGDERISYAELDRRSGRLALALQASGAGPETVVGVALQRSAELVVALLAVMRTGAAYVPLDLEYPMERLAWMIQDSGMSLMITRPACRDALPEHGHLPVLAPDAQPADAGPAFVDIAVDERCLAYLIYTSGSTGRPKAVAVSQGPLSRHCQAIMRLYEMGPATRELHFMSFAFDGAQERWLSVLASGGALVIRDGELWTAEQTLQALWQHEITIACFPPAYLKQLAEAVHDAGHEPPPVDIYCFGGDAVPEQTFEQVKAALRPRLFTNGYGPTETVVTPLLWKAGGGARCEAAYAPIGHAVGCRTLHILDNDLNPSGIGFAGELMIGGDGIARGYHGRAGLTAERFVPDPAGEGGRMYRSGDVVRQRLDGLVDYVGRADHQVKLRGFRVELGEIEACLRAQPGIRNALVVVRESPVGKQLVGYVVSEQAGIAGELKARLADQLPDYMVPAYLIELAQFPVTPNGKIDRLRLPEPEFVSTQFQPARNQRESILVDIWEQVLQVDDLSITDNFFERGGDSILSLQVVSRVRNHPQLDLDLKLRDLMRYQTIEAIVAHWEAAPAVVEAQLSTEVDQRLFNLLPIQQWMFEQQLPDPAHFNQALMLRPRAALDLVALEQALQHIELHHDALRLRFSQPHGQWMQCYGEPSGSTTPRLNLHRVESMEAMTALANQAQRSLDLAQGPLWRTLHIQLPDGQARLLLILHHLVMDGVSWRILLEDLQTAYAACCLGTDPVLPARTSSYRSWVERLQAEATSIEAQQGAWWLDQVRPCAGKLPCDNPRGRNHSSQQAVSHFRLTPQQTTQLLKQAPAAYGTQVNDILLTALGRALGRWTGQEAVMVQLEGHGREDLFEGVDVSRTLGWFNSLFPVRLTSRLDDTAAQAIRSTQRQLAAIPEKGIGYAVLRQFGSGEMRRQLLEGAQAEVTFNYFGQFDQHFDEHALLEPAADDPGDCYHADANLVNQLQTVGQVYDGVLSFRCIYSKRRYRAETIERLMEQFQRELVALIEHCVDVTVPA